jgi:hypothetical protein
MLFHRFLSGTIPAMHDESRHPATEENQLVQIRKEKL